MSKYDFFDLKIGSLILFHDRHKMISGLNLRCDCFGVVKKYIRLSGGHELDWDCYCEYFSKDIKNG